jgi:hypothetical protein
LDFVFVAFLESVNFGGALLGLLDLLPSLHLFLPQQGDSVSQ